MKINKNPFVTEKYLENDLFIVLDNRAYILTGTTPFIWKTIGQGIKREELLERILEEYNVEERKAAKDLDKILMELSSINAIESIEG